LAAGLAATAAPGRAAEPGSPIRFHSEVVRLVVAGDSIEVQGLYRFVNRTGGEIPLSLFYPYPADTLLGAARMVSLSAAPAIAPASFTETADPPGARWLLRAPAGDTLLVRSVYRQGRPARYARYIVTTTSAWADPLVHARFEIVLPDSARAPRFSFPFERRQGPGGTMYVFEAASFRPDRDIEAWW
jgi:hypothetical protein